MRRQKPITCMAREWLVHRILSFTLRAHATLRRIQNLNGLSIVFYRSDSAHTRPSDVNMLYRQVWGSLKLAPNKPKNHTSTSVYYLYFAKMKFCFYLEKSGPAKTGPARPVPTPMYAYMCVHTCTYVLSRFPTIDYHKYHCK